MLYTYVPFLLGAKWRGTFQGKEKVATIALEVFADSSLRIWHLYPGSPGTHNDLIILDSSPILDAYVKGERNVSFFVNGNEYSYPYLLVDGIYPPWAVFVDSFSLPLTPKQVKLSCYQESRRKDVERCFGLLQAKWKILSIPARLWDQDELVLIIKTCVILHNMIVEDEKDMTLEDYVEEDNLPNGDVTIESYLNYRGQLRNRLVHDNLKDHLIEHIWNLE